MYGIFPRVYCNNKCSSKQIRGFDEGGPMTIKTHFISWLIFTFIIIIASIFIFLDNLTGINILTLIFVILWIIILNGWRIHFLLKRELNRIK